MDDHWHKKIIQKIKKETKCSHETAMDILGEMVELNQTKHIDSYNRGYNEGFKKGKGEIK